ncbi:hypothetical protein N9P96_00060 [bacterium]|nr:hypothetical protein [bacterium]
MRIKIISLLLLFVFLNFEIDLTNIQSLTRISQGYDEQGGLMIKKQLSISLKPLDLVSIICFFLNILNFIRDPKIRLQTKGFYYRVNSILLFTCYTLFFIVMQDIASTQKLTAILYLGRLFLVLNLYIYFYIYFSKHGTDYVLKNILIYSAIFSLIGLLSNFGILNSALFVANRSDYYGLLILCFIFLLTNYNKKTNSIYIFTLVVVSLSVLTSGKEGPILILLGVLSFMIFKNLQRQLKLTFMALALMSFCLLIFDGVGAFNSGSVTNPLVGQRTEYADLLRNYNLSFLSLLDASMVERLAKVILSFTYIIDDFLFGIGFWCSIFIYDFLPDSILQAFLELGLIGILLFIRIFRNFDLHQMDKQKSTKGFRLITIFILLAGVSFNVFYSFQIITMLCVILAYSDFHSSSGNKGISFK